MGTKTASGFTIIEVMLFLAVTGALAAGVLVGSGISIGQQRYKDSVNSLKSLLQSQYSETANTVNDRSGVESCNSSAAITPFGSSQARGTSSCLLMGRFLAVDPDGKTITISNVIGSRIPDAPVGTNDIAELQNYKLAASPLNQEHASISWGAQLVVPKSTSSQPLSMLIVRSPLSGSTFTFSSTLSPQPTLKTLVDTSATTSAQTVDLCVQGAAGTFVGNQLAVRINPYASSPSAIEIPAEGANVCS